MTFVTRNWRGLTFLGLGLITILAAHFFLDTCADAGKFITTSMGSQVKMGCSWTERAVQGFGGLVGLMGLILLIWPKAFSGLSLAAAGTGLLMLVTPLWLIPTCANAMMPCNAGIKPGAVILGAVITVAGLVAAVRLRRYEAGGTKMERTA